MNSSVFRILTFLAYIAIFFAFVYLAHNFIGFYETYWCRDDGGVVNAGACVGAEHGQWTLSTRIPVSGWFIALGIPAIAAVFIWKMAQALLKLVWRRKERPLLSAGKSNNDPCL